MGQLGQAAGSPSRGQSQVVIGVGIGVVALAVDGRALYGASLDGAVRCWGLGGDWPALRLLQAPAGPSHGLGELGGLGHPGGSGDGAADHCGPVVMCLAVCGGWLVAGSVCWEDAMSTMGEGFLDATYPSATAPTVLHDAPPAFALPGSGPAASGVADWTAGSTAATDDTPWETESEGEGGAERRRRGGGHLRVWELGASSGRERARAVRVRAGGDVYALVPAEGRLFAAVAQDLVVFGRD